MSKRNAITARALSAQVLDDNADFQGFIAEVRDAQTAVFLNAGSTPAAREEAHAIIRALAAITQVIGGAIDAEKFAKHKGGQHRGND
mgnify:FL=1